MNLITAIFSTILSSFSDIYFKKALKYNINLWNNDFLGQILPLFIFLFFYFFVWFSFDTKLDLTQKSLFFVFLSLIFFTIWRYYHSKIFKVEKITYLLPYENLSKIFTIMFSFFIFLDISKITFIITIIVIFVIIIFTIDFKKITFSKNILIFAFSHLFFAIWNLLLWYVLLEVSKWWLWVSSFSFITTYLIIWVIVFLLPFLFFKWYLELKNINLWFYYYRWISWFLSWFSWFLSMVVISNLGLSISVLLSFLWLLSTLFFAFFILKDSPTKKDIYLTIIVSILISIWFYFK